MLPKNLKYGSKIESAPSRSYRTNIAPQNGTGIYNLTGDTIIINIPTRNNLVLAPSESYLKFNLNVKSTYAGNNYLRWDSGGAHGIIQIIRIFHGSNLIQDIDNYGLLAKMLFDLQNPTDSVMGKLNILTGTRNDLVATLPTEATVNATDLATAQALANALKADFSNQRISCNQVNSGDYIRSTGASTNKFAQNDTGVTTYCLNLISLVGSLCSSNYFPLFACSSAPLRVEIQLVDSIVKAIACTSSAITTTLDNVEYIAQFIELGDSAMSMVNESLGGQPLQFVVPDYRNFQYSYQLATSATQVNFPIPAKFSSLKSLFLTIRDQGTGNVGYFPLSSATKQLNNYYFRVGSNVVPTKAPSTYPEMFSEVLKAIGSLSDINHQPSIELASYTLQDSVANTDPISSVNSGSFYIGLDVENYAGASKDSIFAGYNSNTDDIFCVLNFNAQGSATTVRFDAFALFDEVVVFENGTAYVKF